MSTNNLTSGGKTNLILVLTGILIVAIISTVVLLRTTTEFIYYAPSEVRLVVITGYSSEESQTDSTPYWTASNKRVRKGYIACPRNIPFGTVVDFEGERYTCEDRLAKKYDDRFDVWFNTKQEAIEYGKQIKEVKIWFINVANAEQK